MAKDSLKDNDVAQTAFTQKAENPFGWDKRARDILDNEAGDPSRQRIQEVVATLEKQGHAHKGRLGNMQGKPGAVVKKPAPQAQAKPEAIPE